MERLSSTSLARFQRRRLRSSRVRFPRFLLRLFLFALNPLLIFPTFPSSAAILKFLMFKRGTDANHKKNAVKIAETISRILVDHLHWGQDCESLRCFGGSFDS